MSINPTLIEWVKNPDGSPGYTWNPLTGCLNHVNGFCKGGGFPCYAYRLAHGRLRERYLANENTIMRFSDGYAPMSLKVTDPFYPRFWPERLDQPIYQTKPSGIFTVDMGELFGDWIPLEWQANIFEVIERCPQHRFYLLTKQPQNLIKFSPFPDNCWVGVTATNADLAFDALRYLRDIKASVKYISFEPLLGKINFVRLDIELSILDWLIIGAQTKPHKPPKIEWVQEIVEAADNAGIPVFQKDNLKPLWGIPPLEDDVILRQEVPSG